MSNLFLKTGFLTALMGASAATMAMPLSDYNLILLNDYNYQGGDVEGSTYIGGHLNTNGQASDFSTKSTFGAGLTVVGDVNASNAPIHVLHGDLVHGGALNATAETLDGTVIHNTNLDISGMWSELTGASNNYSQLSANGSLDALTSNQKQLTYTGNADTAVFNYSADELFAQNTSLLLNAGNADTVIINVSGTDIYAGGGTNLVSGFNSNGIGASNILWNFYEAESINFNNLAMWGSILAVNADLSGGAVFDGSVAASSYTGAREFHDFKFDAPEVSVSEPGAFALLALGLTTLFRRRRSA